MSDRYPYAQTRLSSDVIAGGQPFGAQAVLRAGARLRPLAQPQRPATKPLAIPSSPLPQTATAMPHWSRELPAFNGTR